MPSSSMEPTIPAGSIVEVDHAAFRGAEPKRWDIVTFIPPKTANASGTVQTWIMRVVGLPGETVEFGTSEISVDGAKLILPTSLKGVTFVGTDAFPKSKTVSLATLALGNDEYFVLGDNSTNANDSRFWGPLPRTSITGRLVAP